MAPKPTLPTLVKKAFIPDEQLRIRQLESYKVEIEWIPTPHSKDTDLPRMRKKSSRRNAQSHSAPSVSPSRSSGFTRSSRTNSLISHRPRTRAKLPPLSSILSSTGPIRRPLRSPYSSPSSSASQPSPSISTDSDFPAVDMLFTSAAGQDVPRSFKYYEYSGMLPDQPCLMHIPTPSSESSENTCANIPWKWRLKKRRLTGGRCSMTHGDRMHPEIQSKSAGVGATKAIGLSPSLYEITTGCKRKQRDYY